MDPYVILGIPRTSSKEEAHRAYRKMAMMHHPDRGGDEETFKRYKAAWDWINEDKPVDDPVSATPYRSSFSDAPASPTRPRPRPGFHSEKPRHAGKPAAGYEERGTRPPPDPKATRHGNRYSVTLTISEWQAAHGVNVPFKADSTSLEFWVRPGSSPGVISKAFSQSTDMIGSTRALRQEIVVDITLRVIRENTEQPEPEAEKPRQPRSDRMVILELMAIGLFTGGSVTALDHLGEKVSVSIPAGHNPDEPIVIPGKGYGTDNDRGNLIVKIEPTFKHPEKFTPGEQAQANRLCEML